MQNIGISTSIIRIPSVFSERDIHTPIQIMEACVSHVEAVRKEKRLFILAIGAIESSGVLSDGMILACKDAIECYYWEGFDAT